MDAPALKSWWFTFGFNSVYRWKYVKIDAESSDEARKKMFALFGDNWSRQYDSAERAGVEQFGLTPVKLRVSETADV